MRFSINPFIRNQTNSSDFDLHPFGDPGDPWKVLFGVVNNYYGIGKAFSSIETVFVRYCCSILTILWNAVPLDMVLAWMPDEYLLNRVLDGISDVQFSNESDAKLSVHEESESEEEGTAEIQDSSNSGNSDVHTDDNGMFFFCLQSLATVYNPIFSCS